MASCLKNLNIYWFAATSLFLWFFFIHAPPVLIKEHALQRPVLSLHLCGAFGISVACIHNCLLTPSLFDGQARPFHVYMGRFGLLAGLVSFCNGAYVAWFQQEDIGFATGITIGGLLQLNASRLGYAAIQRYQQLKKKLEDVQEDSDEFRTLSEQKDVALKEHISQMLVVFIFGCLIPASIRIIQKFNHQMYAAILAFLALRVVLDLYTKTMTGGLDKATGVGEALLE